jgi:uncharacterized protein
MEPPITQAEPPDEVEARYRAALDAFVERVRQDPYVLAVVLVGSLSHSKVWEKSDIDLFLVMQEVKLESESFTLLENGVVIHAYLLPRSAFRKTMESAVQSSFIHSLLNHGTVYFTRDDTLRRLFEDRSHLGERDRQIQLLRFVAPLLPTLTKAEKWLRARGDVEYCCFWLMKCLDPLAAVETIWNGEVTGREVVHQALRHNPEFFGGLYRDLIHGEKTAATMDAALRRIDAYLLERAPVLFAPLFEYLEESGAPRAASELAHHFSRQLNVEGIEIACEWLADQGLLGCISTPARLTSKSRATVEEAAYFVDRPPL